MNYIAPLNDVKCRIAYLVSVIHFDEKGLIFEKRLAANTRVIVSESICWSWLTGEFLARADLLSGLTLEQVTLLPDGTSHSIYEELWHAAG
jgi:hypothetical protein